ncbi:hypothetical protein QE152_g29610 [Popillia japonica]|uniref:Uncharacterized protein n=1 Tax=Popillia japonica TaxID=7064 RepID=A0AAW1JHG6_POPJA
MKGICEEAMDQVTTTGVIKLEGAKNWNVWKFQIGVILRSLDLLDIVEGKIVKPEAGQEKGTWLTKDAKAQSLIVTRLSEEVMLHILTCGSANGMWSKLHSVYEQKSDIRR